MFTTKVLPVDGFTPHFTVTGRFQRSQLNEVELGDAYRVAAVSASEGKDRIDKAAAAVGWVMRLFSVSRTAGVGVMSLV